MSEIVSYLEKVTLSHMDDVILIILGFLCIPIGRYYRKIGSSSKKEIFGNSLGVLIIVITTSRSNFFHIFVCFAICAGIILLHKKIQCHIFVCIFMFLYLLFFRETNYFGLQTPPHQRFTYLTQMILTLKLVGLAFEVKDATLKCRKASKEEYEQIPYHEKELAEITLKNIFGYCFNYVSVITGPYVTYRTYRDSFVEKYSSDEKLSEACERNIVEKFKPLPFMFFVCLVTNYFWPLEKMFDDAFYTEESFLLRMWYIWPVFLIFRMKMYCALIFSECLFSAAGIGAYPTVFQSIPGRGPRTKDPQLLEDWDGTYDFNTIKNCDIYTVETCWNFRDYTKSWNMCVQYWMVMNVYKRFPFRKFRTAATLLVSAFWHGSDSGYYFSITMGALYVLIEDLCLRRLRSSFGVFPLWLKVCLGFYNIFAFSYMAMAFQLVTFSRVWRYYNSVFYYGYIVFACQFALALFWPKIFIMLLGRKPRSSEKAKENGNGMVS